MNTSKMQWIVACQAMRGSGWKAALAGLLLLMLVAAGSFAPAVAYAQAPAPNLTVCFVIDSSGSMGDNDPADLRITAVKLFIALLDEGDAACLVNFNTTSQVRARVTPISGPADKTRLMATLDGIRPDGWTDMRAALADAVTLLAEDKPSNQRVIIFLTDGKAELKDGLPADYETATLGLVRQSGVPVLAVGLTRGGLTPLLGQVVQAAGPGSTLIPARTATDVLDVYLGILGKLKDRVVLGENTTAVPGTADLTIDASLAPYVERASFIAAMSDGVSAEFFAPDGGKLAPSDPRSDESFGDARYAVISLPGPGAGMWSMRFAGGGIAQARAIVRSRLRVRVLQPGYIHPLGKPMPIAVQLVKEERGGSPSVSIGEATFSALVERPDGRRDSIDSLRDDGDHGDAKASDGTFSSQYVNTDTPGSYNLTITGLKGGVVPVSSRARVEIVPFPYLAVDSPAPGLEVRGSVDLKAHLTGGDPPELDQGSVEALVQRPDGTREAPLSLTGAAGQFGATYIPAVEGTYTVTFRTRGAVYRGIADDDQASASFNAVIIPTLTLEPEEIDLGALASFQEGETVAVRLTSTSGEPEVLDVSVVGLSGASVTPAQVTVEARAAGQNVAVRITSPVVPAPGPHADGVYLVFTRHGRAVLNRDRVRLGFTIVDEMITLDPPEFSLRLDGGRPGAELVVRVKGSLARNVGVAPTVAVVDSPQGARYPAITARAEPEIIPAGEGGATLKLALAWSGEWSPGDYRLAVKLEPGRSKVGVQPETLVVRVHVPGICERVCIPIGMGAALALAGLVGVWATIPAPSGRLVGMQGPKGKPETIYLSQKVTPRSGFDKRVKIGRAPGSHVRLDHASVAEHQAVIAGARREVKQTVGSPPRQRTVTARRKVTVLMPASATGKCTVNGTVPPASGRVLARGDKVQLGDYLYEFA